MILFQNYKLTHKIIKKQDEKKGAPYLNIGKQQPDTRKSSLENIRTNFRSLYFKKKYTKQIFFDATTDHQSNHVKYIKPFLQKMVMGRRRKKSSHSGARKKRLQLHGHQINFRKNLDKLFRFHSRKRQIR